MTDRENTLRALRRDNPERVPFDFVLSEPMIELFKEKTGAEDYMEYFGFPFRYVHLAPTEKKTDYYKYYKNLQDPEHTHPLSYNPEFGVMGVSKPHTHLEEMLHPMQDFTSVQEVLDYPMPDFDADYRWAPVRGQVEELHGRDLIAVATMEMTLFEIAWYLRGMHQFMIDMLEDPEFVNTLLDRITELRIAMTRNYARAGVDIIRLGDDVSTQLGMMMDKELWKEFFKERLRSVIKAAKDENPDVLIFYHGDGNLYDVIPELIDAGVDILNPVQPECVDPVRVKKEFGDRLSFWGTIGTQTTMPFGTPEEVKAECKHMIETVGRGGGLLLAPTHWLQPEVPWENIIAFTEAVKEYGRY